MNNAKLINLLEELANDAIESNDDFVVEPFSEFLVENEDEENGDT